MVSLFEDGFDSWYISTTTTTTRIGKISTFHVVDDIIRLIEIAMNSFSQIIQRTVAMVFGTANIIAASNSGL